jgi:hypothetical protein
MQAVCQNQGRLLFAALFGLMGLGAGCTTADLRTPPLKEHGLTDAAAQRGRELLTQTAEAHGLAAWRGHHTLEITAVDEWAGGWMAQGWWPKTHQRFRMQMILDSFTSRVELLNGPAAGEVWGVQAWRGYKQSAAADTITFSDAKPLTFYLPTLHYFTELPFRLLNANIAAYAGVRTHRGRTYDLVLVTWHRVAPQLDVDQYLLWIGRESRLIEKCRYTLRDAYDWAAGTIHYDDYRMVDGVYVAFRQTVTLDPVDETEYPLDEHFFHQLVLEQARFDTVDQEALIMDASRPVGDHKPAGYNPLDF